MLSAQRSTTTVWLMITAEIYLGLESAPAIKADPLEEQALLVDTPRDLCTAALHPLPGPSRFCTPPTLVSLLCYIIVCCVTLYIMLRCVLCIYLQFHVCYSYLTFGGVSLPSSDMIAYNHCSSTSMKFGVLFSCGMCSCAWRFTPRKSGTGYLIYSNASLGVREFLCKILTTCML